MSPPSFNREPNPSEGEAWILDIEKHFDVLSCSESQKVTFATLMLVGEVEHWWRMQKRLIGDQEPIVWDQFKEASYKKYFLESIRCQRSLSLDS